jgi:hypothetical protein
MIRHHLIGHVGSKPIPLRYLSSDGRLTRATAAADPVNVLQPCRQSHGSFPHFDREFRPKLSRPAHKKRARPAISTEPDAETVGAGNKASHLPRVIASSAQNCCAGRTKGEQGW